jgi:peptidoglycan L-alanyl-D-glutamate endopeptidase CwlK
MDTISEQRLKGLYAPFAEKVRQLIETLAAEGIYVRIVQGVRTWTEQDALYAQGRTAPGKIVTNAQGGQSWHCYGLAADLVPSKHGPDQAYDPDWNSEHPAWKRMIEVGKGLGLTSGADWVHLKDMPHFQMTGKFPEAAPTPEVRNLALIGLENVWKSAFGVES